MSASRQDIQTLFRQLFVRNMTASDADEASDRLLDLYFSDGAVDVSDSNLSALNMSSAGNCNAVTVNATTAVNTVDARATNVNATVGNITTAITTDTRATNVNATVGNVTDVRATNVNATVGNITTVAATNINTQAALIRTAYVNFTNVNGATCSSTNAIQAGWFVIGVSGLVVNTIGNGVTSVNVGDGSDDDEFCILAANTAGTNCGWNGTAHAPELFAANTNVVLTPITAEFNGTGNVSVQVVYMKSIY
jgi:hypothetical protein